MPSRKGSQLFHDNQVVWDTKSVFCDWMSFPIPPSSLAISNPWEWEVIGVGLSRGSILSNDFDKNTYLGEGGAVKEET